MKNIRILLFVIIMFALMLSVFADELNPLVYQYSNPDRTVEFSEPLNVSYDRQQSIADEIAGIHTNSMVDPEIASPNNLICTIFGHNITGPVTVTATYHKVNPYEPRCRMEIYHITYCTRCDYTDKELIGSTYIFCCPDD